MTRLHYLPLILLAALLCIGGCGGSPESEFRKGLSEFGRKRYSEAIISLNRAAQEIGDSAELYYTLGLSYLHLGDTDKALEALNKTTDIDATHCEALVCLGQIAYHEMELADSLKCYETALKLSPEPHTKAVLYTSMALTQSGLKNNGLARLYLIRALSCDPNYAPALYNLGSLYRDKFGFREEALECFEDYLKIAPKKELHFEKAQNNVERLNKNIERTSPDKGVKRDAIAASQFLKEGVTYQAEKKYREAIGAYDAALKADPLAFSAAYGRAMAYQKLGNDREAFAAFKQALAINPDHQDSYARAVSIAIEQKRFTEAVALLDKAIARNPHYVSWYDLMARALFGQTKYNEALNYGEYYLSLLKPGDEGRSAYEKWLKALREAG